MSRVQCVLNYKGVYVEVLKNNVGDHFGAIRVSRSNGPAIIVPLGHDDIQQLAKVFADVRLDTLDGTYEEPVAHRQAARDALLDIAKGPQHPAEDRVRAATALLSF